MCEPRDARPSPGAPLRPRSLYKGSRTRYRSHVVVRRSFRCLRPPKYFWTDAVNVTQLGEGWHFAQAPRVVAQPKSYDVRRVTAALVRKPFRSLKKNPFRTDALIFPSEKSSKATGCRESRSLAGDASMAKNSRSELLSQAHLKFSQKPFEKKKTATFPSSEQNTQKTTTRMGPTCFKGNIHH